MTNVQAANAGAYDVVVSNAAGLATSAPATLAVSLPEVHFLSTAMLTNGQVQLLFSGVPGQDYIIQAHQPGGLGADFGAHRWQQSPALH